LGKAIRSAPFFIRKRQQRAALVTFGLPGIEGRIPFSHEFSILLCHAGIHKPYRDMAKLLASDLATYAPDYALVVATDAVEDFKEYANVFAYHHHRTGLFACYSDKRFAVSHALESHAEEVVFIDADTRVHENLPSRVESDAKIVAAYAPQLAEQAQKWLLPKSGRAVLTAARAFGIDPAQTKFVLDNIFAVKRDHGREKVFIEVWGLVTRLFDFEGVDISDGYCMSIAAAVTGWIPSDTGLEPFIKLTDHHEVSHLVKKPGPLAKAVRKALWQPKLLKHRLKVIRSIKVPKTI
jgi:hypothetical protein